VTQAPTPHVTQAPTPHVTQAPTPHVTQAPTPHVTQAPTPPPPTSSSCQGDDVLCSNYDDEDNCKALGCTWGPPPPSPSDSGPTPKPTSMACSDKNCDKQDNSMCWLYKCPENPCTGGDGDSEQYCTDGFEVWVWVVLGFLVVILLLTIMGLTTQHSSGLSYGRYYFNKAKDNVERLSNKSTETFYQYRNRIRPSTSGD
jgi:hypothetical protein